LGKHKIPEEDVGTKIRNLLVLPSTVLQLLIEDKKIPKNDINEALEALKEIVTLTKLD